MFYILLTGFTLGAILISTTLHLAWADWRWHDEPLHSSIEAVGGLAAIAMGMVLLQAPHALKVTRHGAFAAGFFGMGILEEFHAITPPGNSFVLFRNLASLAGSIGFVLVWRTSASNKELEPHRLAGLIGTAALSVGALFLIFPEYIPEMVRNGELTPTAVAPQSLACVLFLAAMTRFVWDYQKFGRLEDRLFASLALLFGMAEFVFMYSIPWDNRWWFWHALRLMASVLALGYITRRYVQVVDDLNASLLDALQAKQTLSQSEERLRQVLDQRERMAEDLHDSAIQSLFALRLNLERCQRLISTNPIDVAGQLGRAVDSIKTVIQELRAYILGSGPTVLNGKTLRSALISLVEDMNKSGPLHFAIEINPVAADQLTPQQAVQVVTIAREAMSNSLQHSAAHTGTVSLHLHGEHIRLIVKDDGVGFSSTAVEGHGHGLKNMHTRVEKLGGRLEIVSKPDGGTEIICDLPQQNNDATS